MKTRNNWSPPKPVPVGTTLPAILGLVAGTASLFVWLVSPSYTRGAPRSYELSLQERRAEIDQVIEDRTGPRDRGGVSE